MRRSRTRLNLLVLASYLTGWLIGTTGFVCVEEDGRIHLEFAFEGCCGEKSPGGHDEDAGGPQELYPSCAAAGGDTDPCGPCNDVSLADAAPAIRFASMAALSELCGAIAHPAPSEPLAADLAPGLVDGCASLAGLRIPGCGPSLATACVRLI